MAPKLPQHVPKLPNLVDFGLQLGGPGGVLERTFGGHFWPLGPSWGQDGPMSLQGASWERFLMVLAPNLVDFGLQDTSWEQF